MPVDFRVQETELATMVNQAKTLHAKINADGDKATAEDRTELNRLIEAGKEKRANLAQLKELAALDDYTSTPEKEVKAVEAARNGGTNSPALLKSWGQAVIESEQFKALGSTPANTQKELMPVTVGSFSHMISQSKAVYAATDATGGYATRPDRQLEVLDIARQRPMSVLDLVNMSTTNSDAVEYVIMDTRTNAAAIVSEYTGGNFGLKPESTITIDLKSAVVNTIATWIAVSRQILNDAPRLRQMIDNELAYMVKVVQENNLITDILAWSGIQSRVHQVSGARFDAGDTIADTLRRAITDIYLEFYQPDGIVLNPAQGEALELLKDGNDAFLRVYDSASARIWRVPVVETAAMTAGTALVANFKLGVTVWDREQTQVLTGQPNDYFLRNAFALLAELREAHAVTRPKAVEKITGL